MSRIRTKPTKAKPLWKPIGYPLPATAIPPRTPAVEFSEMILTYDIVQVKLRSDQTYQMLTGKHYVEYQTAPKDLKFCKLSLDDPRQINLLVELARTLYEHGGALPIAACQYFDQRWAAVMEETDDS